MKKNRIITCLFLAVAIAFGNPICANAQFSKIAKGLGKKAKEKVEKEIKSRAKETVNSVVEESTGGTIESTTNAAHPKTLADLNPELFPYQPYGEGDNTYFYDTKANVVKKGYSDFCGALTCADYSFVTRRDGYALPEFVGYKSSRGNVYVPIVEYPMTAYLSAFMLDPNNPATYRYYVRANIIHEAFRWGRVVVVRGDQNSLKTKNSKGETINLYETEYNRFQRWSKATGEASEIYDKCTAYETVGSAAVGTINQIQEFIDNGNKKGAVTWMRELDMIMEHMDKHPKNPHNADYTAVVDLYKELKEQTKEYADDVASEDFPVADMPTAVSVDATTKAGAERAAKDKFGDKFVKVLITSGWKDFQSKEWPYPITHRSCDIAVITKEKGTYFINRWCLLQNYSGGKPENSYRIQAAMGVIVKQKVNYK